MSKLSHSNPDPDCDRILPNGWGVYLGNQVVPMNDLRQHELDASCWCHPEWDGEVLVHNAMDKRELYERDELKQH
jgi:hypothetical protein